MCQTVSAPNARRDRSATWTRAAASECCLHEVALEDLCGLFIIVSLCILTKKRGGDARSERCLGDGSSLFRYMYLFIVSCIVVYKSS